MSQMKAALAVFDLGGVLLAPKTGNWYLTEPVLRFLQGVRYGEQNMAESLAAARTAVAHRIHAKTITEEQAVFYDFYRVFFAHLCPGLQVNEHDLDAFSEYRARSDDQYLWDLDAIDAIRTIHSNIDTALFSNTWPSVIAALRKEGFLDAFSYTFFSCEVGMKKPDHRFFALLAEQTHSSPHEIVLYDDSQLVLQEAHMLGFQTRTAAFGTLSTIITEDFREESKC